MQIWIKSQVFFKCLNKLYPLSLIGFIFLCIFFFCERFLAEIFYYVRNILLFKRKSIILYIPLINSVKHFFPKVTTSFPVFSFLMAKSLVLKVIGLDRFGLTWHCNYLKRSVGVVTCQQTVLSCLACHKNQHKATFVSLKKWKIVERDSVLMLERLVSNRFSLLYQLSITHVFLSLTVKGVD